MLGVFTDCLLVHVVTGGSTKGLILWGQGVLKSLQYGVVMGDRAYTIRMRRGGRNLLKWAEGSNKVV